MIHWAPSYTKVNEPCSTAIVAFAPPSIVLPAAGVITIGAVGDARPDPSLIVNVVLIVPTGKLTATGTDPGTFTLITLSVAALTVIGVVVTTLTAMVMVLLPRFGPSAFLSNHSTVVSTGAVSDSIIDLLPVYPVSPLLPAKPALPKNPLDPVYPIIPWRPCCP